MGNSIMRRTVEGLLAATLLIFCLPGLAADKPNGRLYLASDDLNQTIRDTAQREAARELVSALTRGNVLTQEQTKEIVRQEVQKMIAVTFIGDIDGLEDAVVREDISPEEWRSITAELSMETLMNKADAYTEEIADAASRAVAEKYPETTKVRGIWDKETVKKFAVKEVEEQTQTLKPHHIEVEYPQIADKSRVWLEIKERLNRDFKIYAYILTSGADKKKLPVEKVRRYKSNLVRFDDYLFPEKKSESKGGFTVSPHVEERGKVLLAIPSMPSMSKICARMDKLRKSALKRLPSNRDERYLKAVSAELEKVIVEEISPAAKVFDYEKAGLSKKKLTLKDAANRQDFESAEESLTALRSQAEDYKERSMNFLEEMNASLKPNGKDLAAVFEAGMARGKARAMFLEDLCEDTVYRSRALPLFVDIENLGALPKRYIKFMTADQISGLIKQAADYKATVKIIKASAAAGRRTES